MQINKKYFVAALAAGASLSIAGAALASGFPLPFHLNFNLNGKDTLAVATPIVQPAPVQNYPAKVVDIGSNGNITLRGTVQSVGTNTMTVASWGGTWTVNNTSTTNMLPKNSAAVAVGDFVGVQGSVVTNASWTVNATMVRDWTTKITNNQLNITGVSGPATLAVNQNGTWTVSVAGTGTGNLSYAVDWGDEVAQPMASNTAGSAYSQSTGLTHVYSQPGTYTIHFSVTNAAGKMATASMTVTVQ